MGFPGAQALFAWLGEHMIGKLTDPGYPVPLVGVYAEPSQKQPNWAWFTSWTETLTAGPTRCVPESPRVLAEHGRGDLLGCSAWGNGRRTASSPVERRRGSGSKTGSPK